MLAHKADTEERHRGLSATSFATWPQLHPRAFISRSTDLLHVSFGRPLLLFPAGVQRMAILGIDVGGILFTWPIHLHLLFFTSNDMGSIPVRSWSSAFGYLVWPKDVQNSSEALVLEYFQHVAYSFVHFPRLCSIYTLSTLLLKMRIFVFLLIIFVFQMFFRAANAPLAVLILVLISASVFPSFVTLAPRYVNSVTSSIYCSRV